MKRLLPLLIVLVLSSCSTNNKQIESAHETIEDNKEDFAKYLALLPSVRLLFESNCEVCCSHPQIDEENKLIQKFKPKGSSILGLVEQNENRAVILVTYAADIIFPSIKVYDMTGRLTGEVSFMTRYCGGEPGYYGRQYFKINQDLSFAEIDTSYYMTFDSTNYETIDTTKIEIKGAIYKVDKSGIIVSDSIH